MATVFLGRRVDAPGVERMAAIKVILAELAKEEEFIAMFADEAKILSRLDHPNISRTLEVGHADHLGYIAMELLLGRTLADTWEAAQRADIPFRFDLAAWICGQIARGLHYAHELKDEGGVWLELVHRDVNPSNIFLTYDGQVKLFDFGLAKSQGRRALTKEGVVKGKVPYLSPEQLQPVPLDRRSDIFSLGTTLWEMTTLNRLFKRPTDLDTILAIRDSVVPDARQLVDDYPEALWTVVSRSLAGNRDDRYATAAEFADDLDAFVASQGAGEMGAFLGAVLDRFYPDERQKQNGWLESAAVLPADVNAPTMVPPAPFALMPDLRTEGRFRSDVSIPLQLIPKKKK
jgi:serine/threonine-protein kinase